MNNLFVPLLLLVASSKAQSLSAPIEVPDYEEASNDYFDIASKRRGVSYISNVIHHDPKNPELTAESVVNVKFNPSFSEESTADEPAKNNRYNSLGRDLHNNLRNVIQTHHQHQNNHQSNQNSQEDSTSSASQLFNVGYSMKFAENSKRRPKNQQFSSDVITGTQKENEYVQIPKAAGSENLVKALRSRRPSSVKQKSRHNSNNNQNSETSTRTEQYVSNQHHKEVSQETRNTKNGWRTVSPNVEIAESKAISTSRPKTRSKKRQRGKSHTGEVRFNHQEALTNSQGFDITDAMESSVQATRAQNIPPTQSAFYAYNPSHSIQPTPYSFDTSQQVLASNNLQFAGYSLLAPTIAAAPSILLPKYPIDMSLIQQNQQASNLNTYSHAQALPLYVDARFKPNNKDQYFKQQKPKKQFQNNDNYNFDFKNFESEFSNNSPQFSSDYHSYGTTSKPKRKPKYPQYEPDHQYESTSNSYYKYDSKNKNKDKFKPQYEDLHDYSSISSYEEELPSPKPKKKTKFTPYMKIIHDYDPSSESTTTPKPSLRPTSKFTPYIKVIHDYDASLDDRKTRKPTRTVYSDFIDKHEVIDVDKALPTRNFIPDLTTQSSEYVVYGKPQPLPVDSVEYYQQPQDGFLGNSYTQQLNGPATNSHDLKYNSERQSRSKYADGPSTIMLPPPYANRNYQRRYFVVAKI